MQIFNLLMLGIRKTQLHKLFSQFLKFLLTLGIYNWFLHQGLSSNISQLMIIKKGSNFLWKLETVNS